MAFVINSSDDQHDAKLVVAVVVVTAALMGKLRRKSSISSGSSIRWVHYDAPMAKQMNRSIAEAGRMRLHFNAWDVVDVHVAATNGNYFYQPSMLNVKWKW